MRLNASFIDLNYRSQRLPDSAFRIFTHFTGWLHLSRLRGLAPLACTNLPAYNSNQMCERNRTLSNQQDISESGHLDHMNDSTGVSLPDGMPVCIKPMRGGCCRI